MNYITLQKKDKRISTVKTQIQRANNEAISTQVFPQIHYMMRPRSECRNWSQDLKIKPTYKAQNHRCSNRVLAVKTRERVITALILSETTRFAIIVTVTNVPWYENRNYGASLTY